MRFLGKSLVYFSDPVEICASNNFSSEMLLDYTLVQQLLLYSFKILHSQVL